MTLRLGDLLEWLAAEVSDVVCLKELRGAPAVLPGYVLAAPDRSSVDVQQQTQRDVIMA